MACGTPVVGCGAGAEQDAVVSLTTGEHVPAGQPGELARQIRKLLASPVRLEAYGIAAADRARSRYCWERIARETAAAYDSLKRHTPASAAAPDGEAAAEAAEQAEEAQQARTAGRARRLRTGARV
jgi:hypothetical protein